MITIGRKRVCCGCSACALKCPTKCISLIEDSEGFLYPRINTDDCINCGLCERVCPVLNNKKEIEPLKTIAAINKNEEIRMHSSSGGIFSFLSEQIINQGGVVFGAKFNDKWEVIHSYTDSIEKLRDFRGSKYVQSIIGTSYKKAEDFLIQGRKVLFSGTPCQIAGLKLYLQKDYQNLLTVDFICHGVPSPKVWKMYLEEICEFKIGVSLSRYSNNPKRKTRYEIDNIEFRNKNSGWKRFSVSFSLLDSNNYKNNKCILEEFDKNLFMIGFLKNLYLRPSCHKCPVRDLKSGSDIKICDFWGIDNVLPDFDDNRGASAVIINRADLLATFSDNTKIEYREVSYGQIYSSNCALKKNLNPHRRRSKFFRKIGQQNLLELISQITEETYLDILIKECENCFVRGMNKIKKIINNL